MPLPPMIIFYAVWLLLYLAGSNIMGFVTLIVVSDWNLLFPADEVGDKLWYIEVKAFGYSLFLPLPIMKINKEQNEKCFHQFISR